MGPTSSAPTERMHSPAVSADAAPKARRGRPMVRSGTAEPNFLAQLCWRFPRRREQPEEALDRIAICREAH